jgi:L-threonylcarbamoyladenylate synthase
VSYQTDNIDDKVVELIMSGAIGVLPTDTIYGLSCSALNKESVGKIHKLKGRQENKPYVLLISNLSQLASLGVDEKEVGPVSNFWPGGLTIICSAPMSPRWLHMGLNSLALRQPNMDTLLKLIDKTGPIISTSVNHAGQKPAVSAEEVLDYFGNELDFVVDYGELQGEPSTIVRQEKGKLIVLRQGAVRIDEKGKI